jgi:hypothetical protein
MGKRGLLHSDQELFNASLRVWQMAGKPFIKGQNGLKGTKGQNGFWSL